MPRPRRAVPGGLAVRVGVVEEAAGGHLLAEVLRQRSSEASTVSGLHPAVARSWLTSVSTCWAAARRLCRPARWSLADSRRRRRGGRASRAGVGGGGRAPGDLGGRPRGRAGRRGGGGDRGAVGGPGAVCGAGGDGRRRAAVGGRARSGCRRPGPRCRRPRRHRRGSSAGHRGGRRQQAGRPRRPHRPPSRRTRSAARCAPDGAGGVAAAVPPRRAAAVCGLSLPAWRPIGAASLPGFSVAIHPNE